MKVSEYNSWALNDKVRIVVPGHRARGHEVLAALNGALVTIPKRKER